MVSDLCLFVPQPARAPADGSGDRPCLTLERRGSTHADDVRAVLAAQGFGLALGPKALKCLPLREYLD